jgi:hypothetical protein
MATARIPAQDMAREWMRPNGEVDWERYRDAMYLISGKGWHRQYNLYTKEVFYVHEGVAGTHKFEAALAIQQSLDLLEEDL